MPHDIDELVAKLRQDHPAITVDRVQPAPDDDADADDGWRVHHPDALTDVQVKTATGDLPFTVQSELAPPTRVDSIAKAVKMIAQRLGLGIAR